MRDKLIAAIREVPISQTYEEYVEALADRLCRFELKKESMGDNIKRLMRENGYDQKQLAMRSGCTESAISRYVRNERTPRVKILHNLAIALGVTVNDIVGG